MSVSVRMSCCRVVSTAPNANYVQSPNAGGERRGRRRHSTTFRGSLLQRLEPRVHSNALPGAPDERDPEARRLDGPVARARAVRQRAERPSLHKARGRTDGSRVPRLFEPPLHVPRHRHESGITGCPRKRNAAHVVAGPEPRSSGRPPGTSAKARSRGSRRGRRDDEREGRRHRWRSRGSRRDVGPEPVPTVGGDTRTTRAGR